MEAVGFERGEEVLETYKNVEVMLGYAQDKSSSCLP